MIKGLRYPINTGRDLTSLETSFDPRRNSLGFLRMLFAIMVMVDHAFPLGGFNHGSDPMWSWTNGQDSMGGLAVSGFFVVSGFLVTRSCVESRTTLAYLWKRILRIIPGYWVCLLVTAVLIAPVAYSFQLGNLHGYLASKVESPFAYLRNNAMLSMNQYNIDGLLSSTPYQHSQYPQAFDGSLWTLIYEFKCYLGVALLGAVGVLRRRRFVVLLLALMLWTVQLEESLHPGRFATWWLLGDSNLTRLAFTFSLGMLLFLYREKIALSDSLATVAFVVLVVGMRTALYSGVGIVALAYLCMWLAVRLPLSALDRPGDFSYGVYIYAFPIEQLLSLYGLNRWGLIPYVLIALLVTLPIAAGSWHLVEKRCLRLKRWQGPSTSMSDFLLARRLRSGNQVAAGVSEITAEPTEG